MATTPPEPFIVKHLMWAHDLSMYSVIIIYITNEEKNVMETTYKTLPRRVSFAKKTLKMAIFLQKLQFLTTLSIF